MSPGSPNPGHLLAAVAPCAVLAGIPGVLPLPQLPLGRVHAFRCRKELYTWNNIHANLRWGKMWFCTGAAVLAFFACATVPSRRQQHRRAVECLQGLPTVDWTFDTKSDHHPLLAGRGGDVVEVCERVASAVAAAADWALASGDAAAAKGQAGPRGTGRSDRGTVAQNFSASEPTNHPVAATLIHPPSTSIPPISAPNTVASLPPSSFFFPSHRARVPVPRATH